jgi:putative transposase
MSSPLSLGDQVIDSARKRTLTVSSTLVISGRIRVLNEEDNTEEMLPLSDLGRGISGGTFRVVRQGAPRLAPSDIADKNLTEAIALALRATRVIQDRAHANRISFNKAIEELSKEHAGGPLHTTLADDDGNQVPTSTPLPSKATLYRYAERIGRNLPPLRGDANKGNRDKRYSDQVIELVSSTASELYLKNGSRWNVTAITKLANQELHDRGLINEEVSVSKKFVKSVILRLSPDPSGPRMDPKDRSAAKSVAKAPIRVNGLLQRVEQDALHLPWRFKTAHGETVNVWLVHAICCASSIPVGFHFVIGSPRESDGLQCIETILYSKAELLASYGVKTDVDLYGAPGLVVFDNGAETKGRMKNLAQIYTDTHYLPSRKPQGKPFIERLNRSLKEALQTLGGCTRLDGVDGQRDPELLGDFPMPLEEFKVWVVRWYYEVWVNTPLKRFIHSRFVEDDHLGDTAAERFRSLTTRGYAYPLPPNRLTWERCKYVHEERTLSNKTGISYEGFEFRGPNLPRLIERFGTSQVMVLVDPDDFRAIYVIDGDENIKLTNIHTDETTIAYSFDEAKDMVKEAKSRLKPSEEAARFWRALFRRSTQTAPSASKAESASGKSKQTAKAARAHAAGQRSVGRAVKQPDAAPAGSESLSLGDVPAYPVLDRKTGAAI